MHPTQFRKLPLTLLTAPNPGTTAQHSFALGCAPAFLAVTGTLETGYRMSVATRDGKLHTLRGREANGTPIQLEAQPVGLVSGPWGERGLVEGGLRDSREWAGVAGRGAGCFYGTQ